MCIIVIKEKGIAFPSAATIKNCCDNNPDGFSMAWSDNGEVQTFRTLDKAAFMRAYKYLYKHLDKKESLIIHARIKTHGSVSLGNCHCWESSGVVFAHNGVLSIQNRGDLTDSETFFRDIFLPIWNGSKHNWKECEKAINAVIGVSRFAFLDEKNGDIIHYGNFYNRNGILYSNTSFERRKFKFTNPMCTTITYNPKLRVDIDRYLDEEIEF